MKKIFLALAFGLLIGLGAYAYIARPCIAGWCPGKCLKRSDCFSGCVCVDVPDSELGKCMPEQG